MVCDEGCWRQAEPEFCKDKFNLPNIACTDRNPSQVEGVWDCREDGDFVWQTSLWIPKKRAVTLLEEGQLCFQFKAKSCVIAYSCTMDTFQNGVDTNGNPVFSYRCVKGTTVKPAGWLWQIIVSGDSCIGQVTVDPNDPSGPPPNQSLVLSSRAAR